MVVGKFSPLHRGHEFLLRTASDISDELLVITYSSPVFSGCEAAKRVRWIEALGLATRVIECDGSAPDNAAEDETHRAFCAQICEDLGFYPDVIVTSESYGPGFANFLAKRWKRPVEHHEVDRERFHHPVSGTMVRANPHDHRERLSPMVYQDFVERVLLIGAESTGKSTLAEALGRSLKTIWVPEFGRDLWESNGGSLCESDMLAIAQKQVDWENRALGWSNRYLICDTSPLSTAFYSEALFGMCRPEVEKLSRRAYQHVFFLAADFPMVQDGTRQDEAFREKQDRWLRARVKQLGWRVVELKGSLAERLELARQHLA